MSDWPHLKHPVPLWDVPQLSERFTAEEKQRLSVRSSRLYDRVRLPPDTVMNSLTLAAFVNVGAASGKLHYDDSNMYQSMKLAAPECFLIRGLYLVIDDSIAVADLQAFGELSWGLKTQGNLPSKTVWYCGTVVNDFRFGLIHGVPLAHFSLAGVEPARQFEVEDAPLLRHDRDLFSVDFSRRTPEHVVTLPNGRGLEFAVIFDGLHISLEV